MSDETTQTALFEMRLRVDTENGSASGALPEVQQPVLEQTKEERCYRCGIELTAENWSLYNKKLNRHWCRACTNRLLRESYRKSQNIAKSSVQESVDFFTPHRHTYIKHSKDTIPVCYKCSVTLGDDNWYRSDRKHGSRWCKSCHGKQSRTTRKEWIKRPGVRKRLKQRDKQWLKAHPGYMQLWENKNGADRHLRQNYGITLEDAVQIADKQEWRCAICRKQFKDVPYRHGTAKSGKADYFFQVDHDHSTGAIRGLLCHNCNSMLGHAKDDGTILRAGADYIDRHVCQKS